MGLLNPPFTVTVTVQRPAFDSRGNPAWTSFTVAAVVSVQPVSKRPRLANPGVDLFLQDAVLYVPRGSDVKAGDHVIYDGWKYIVDGRARGNQLHPFTGADFGWVPFSMQAQG